MEAVGMYGNHLFRTTLSAPSWTTVWLPVPNFSAKKFLLTVRLPTELLRRAAETDRGVASLLSVHPRNADGAILLVHLRG